MNLKLLDRFQERNRKKWAFDESLKMNKKYLQFLLEVRVER